jgi:hypothetical protein
MFKLLHLKPPIVYAFPSPLRAIFSGPQIVKVTDEVESQLFVGVEINQSV